MARFFLNPSALGFYNTLKGKYPTSNMEGDGQQTGGVFVISPEGKLLYSFKEGDHEPSMTKLIAHTLALCLTWIKPSSVTMVAC
jgi:hypothetical protein